MNSYFEDEYNSIINPVVQRNKYKLDNKVNLIFENQ